MPDIDEQVLAGALSTCTHGTGAGIGALPTFVVGMDIVLASGEEVRCNARHNSELFRAVQVSLGALGVITSVTLQNTEPYRLRRESWIEDWDTTLDEAQLRADKHRNFEFYYVPFSDRCFVHTHDFSDEQSHATPMHDQNEAVLDLKTVRDYLGWSDTLRSIPIKALGALIDREVQVEASWLSYASERNVRFNEMEYHLPRESGLDALREIRQVLESGHREVFFPIEVRFIKGDDIWLSPFQGRDSMSIAVHRYYAEDYQAYFDSIEPILRKYGGRPHWGKLNSLAAKDFAQLYPHWNEWLAVRQDVDPGGKFLNPYLRKVFGVPA